jgi:molybdate transport system ATP-binding protein
MTLTASLQVAFRGVDVAFTIPAGTTLALLGPNGSGKTTILETIAGILAPDVGSLTHGERPLLDTEAGIDVSPRDRFIALVSQSDSLFPTMTALDNVAFGARARGAGREESREIALSWLRQVGAAELAQRRPGTLSGGQARRVAIARAMASSPRIVLLDEPFAGLDLESATAIRALLAEALEGVTAIIATHAVLDAHSLASTIVVLDSGRVAESGPVTRVLTKPHTAFAARMAGRVLLTGVPEKNGIRLSTGELVACETEAVAAGAAAAIAIHPRDISLEPHGIADVVTALEPHGDLVRVHGIRFTADVDPLAVPLPRPGEAVRFAVAASGSAYSV